eukprot:959012-Prymnesium_polylepis.1
MNKEELAALQKKYEAEAAKAASLAAELEASKTAEASAAPAAVEQPKKKGMLMLSGMGKKTSTGSAHKPSCDRNTYSHALLSDSP